MLDYFRAMTAEPTSGPFASARRATALLLLACTALPALAQAQTPQVTDAAATSPGAGDDIVVTAQRREERLQDVPISVAVVTPEQLQAFGQNATIDLAYRVPNLTLNNGASARQFGFFIRGYGSTSFSPETVESSSAFVLDGVVMGLAGGALMDLPDVERVEVLRGPQGTLFGKNAGAGVVNVVTRRPSREQAVEVSASVASPQFERKISAYLTGPISDEVRFSISGRYNGRDGHIENQADDRSFNGDTNYGVRGRLEIEPSDNLLISFTADWWQRDSDCCAYSIIRGSNVPTAFELEQIAAGIEFGRNNREQNLNGPVYLDNESYGFSAQLDYEFGGGHTFTSISAYRGWSNRDNLDLDNRPVNIFDVNNYRLDQNQFTQEFRITSPADRFIDYVAGLFYFKQNNDGDGAQRNVPSTALRANRDYSTSGETENLAVFGQANINFTPDFRVIVGARLLRENIQIDRRQFDPVNNVTATVSNDRSDEALVWRLGLQYDLAEDSNVFATVTRGFKGGGFDSGPATNTATRVNPEVPTAYEVGLRTRFRDAGVTFNVTGFWQDIEDLQVQGRDPNNTLSFFLLNAATARTRGVEVEASWRPSREVDLVFDLSGSYTDPTFRRFRDAPCWRGQTAAQGCIGGVQDLSGARLPYAQEFNVALTTSFSAPLGANLKFIGNVFASYRSEANHGSVDDPLTVQPAYPLIHLAVGIGGADDGWSARVFVRNLTDEVYTTREISSIFGGAGGYGGYIPYDAQRVIGAAVNFRF